MAMPAAPAASFKFNQIAEIKSHSSILYNERMAILFYLLDMRSIDMNTCYKITDVMYVRSILKQIYKNVRTLIRNNPIMRSTLNLETHDGGIYTTDVAIGTVDKMIMYCEINGFTTKHLYIIIEELNQFEMMIKDILQYFHYFIRPDFRQKPDVELATEKYKEIADKQTVEQLREIVGKKHNIDFEQLGSSRIELREEIEYDENIDTIEEKEEVKEEQEQEEQQNES
jgi:hypothetical protein